MVHQKLIAFPYRDARMAAVLALAGLLCLVPGPVPGQGLGPDATAEESVDSAVTAVSEEPEAAEPVNPTSSALTVEEVIALTDQLRAAEFTVRQQATLRLRDISAAQVPVLVEASLRHTEAEASSRAMAVLGQIFISDDEDRVRAASEALETATGSTRLHVARSAIDLLRRHWKRRCDLAEVELAALGVSFNPGRLSSHLSSEGADVGQARIFLGRRAAFMGQPLLQINLDRNWKGGDRGIQLLKRIASIANIGNIGNGPGDARIGLYLIDGHALSEDQTAELRSAFGDARVVRRGRVCLGITGHPFASDTTGCRVGEVRAGTSADDAGLQPEDVILSVDGTAIRDFEHLVELLRKYDVGDKVTMSIRRGDAALGRNLFPPAPGDPEDQPDQPVPPLARDIEVHLKGWN